MQQVLPNLGDECGAHRLRQSFPQQTEKDRATHHDQSLKFAPAVRLLELRRYPPCEDFRLVLARGLLTSRRMTRRGTATTGYERRTIELSARAVGHEVPVTQMCNRIR